MIIIFMWKIIIIMHHILCYNNTFDLQMSVLCINLCCWPWTTCLKIHISLDKFSLLALIRERGPGVLKAHHLIIKIGWGTPLFVMI